MATAPVAASVLTVGTSLTSCDFIDLAQAIGAANSGDVLHLETATFIGVSGQNFNINTKDLTIEGGYANCNATVPTGVTTLTGTGADSVVEIATSSPHSILLRHLKITGGADDADDGGGIEIDGQMTVTLLDVEISGNSSERGGGIHLDGANGASVFLGEGSVIKQNDATIDGGGIYCLRSGTVTLEAPVTVDHNDSAGNGGGLWIGDSCHVDLHGSEIPDLLASVNFNTADGDGGGLYIVDGGTVSGFGGDLGSVEIGFNEAGLGAGTGIGGGIYAGGLGTTFDLDRGIIGFNEADQGAGLYVENGAEASLLSAGPCNAGVAGWCSFLAQNRAPFAAALAVTDGAVVDLELTMVYGNGPELGEVGEAPIALVATGGQLNLVGSVAYLNTDDSGSAIAGIVDTGGAVSVKESTFVGNFGSDHLFWVGGSFSGEASIFAVGAGNGDLFNVQTAGSWSLDCALVASDLTVPAGGTSITMGNALLKDPTHLDFHLLSGSPAIDLCPGTVPALAVDFDSDPRPLGLGLDAGADEHDPPLFEDGFETGDTTAWNG